MIYTIEELKTFLPSFVSDENAALALHFLSVAQAEVENRTGRLLQPVARSVTDILRTQYAYIKYLPFSSVEISKDDGALAAGDDYTLDAETGRLFFSSSFVQKELTVSYSAGYATNAEVPPLLKQAALDIITWLLRKHEKAGVTSSDYGNVEIVAENRMPLSVLDLLLQYKVVNLGGQRW